MWINGFATLKYIFTGRIALVLIWRFEHTVLDVTSQRAVPHVPKHEAMRSFLISRKFIGV